MRGTKYLYLAITIVQLIVGLVTMPLFYLLYLMLTNLSIVYDVSNKLQIPFWYPILGLALFLALGFTELIGAIYLIYTKKYRIYDLPLKIVIPQAVILFVLFVVLPMFLEQLQFFIYT